MNIDMKMISLDMKNQPAINASNHPSIMTMSIAPRHDDYEA